MVFQGRPNLRRHLYLPPVDPRCHGNQIWDKIAYNSACVRDICEIFGICAGVFGNGPSNAAILPGNDLRQVVHAYVPLSPSSIIWYRLHCWDVNRHTARYTGPVSMVSQCKNWCLAEGLRKRRSARPMGRKAREGLYDF